MKMELIEGSETSAKRTQTPGNYPKRKYIIYRTQRKLKIKIWNRFVQPKLCTNQSVHILLWISEQTALILVHGINLPVFFITEAENVYRAVRTWSLNETDIISSIKGLNVLLVPY